MFALAVCDMLDRNPGKSMAELKNALPKTWSSPTMSPHCEDEIKYRVVDAVVQHFEQAKAKGEKVAGQSIRDLVTVNGVRVTVEDGSWGLVRASSNKPELVVVVESPVSEARMHDMFKAVDTVLRTHPEVGEYNQTIWAHREAERAHMPLRRALRARAAVDDGSSVGAVLLLAAPARQRFDVGLFHEHFDQGADLRRDRAFAPDENGRSHTELRRHGVNAQQLEVGEGLEDHARDHRNAHACHRATENRVVGGGLDHAIGHLAAAGEPIVQALAVRTAGLEGEHRPTIDVLRRLDRRMIRQ